jgi:hypothetical protein
MTDLPETPANMDALGISWFREEDWPRWCAIDPDFQPEYQHWLKRTEEAIREATGKVVLKITVDPDEFLTWSRATGSGVGTDARSRYVVIKTMHRRTAN